MSAPGVRRPPPVGFDLLRIPAIRRLVLWPGFAYVFQAAALVAFLALVAGGWGRYTPDGVDAKLFAKANLVTLIVRGIW